MPSSSVNSGATSRSETVVGGASTAAVVVGDGVPVVGAVVATGASVPAEGGADVVPADSVAGAPHAAANRHMAARAVANLAFSTRSVVDHGWFISDKSQVRKQSVRYRYNRYLVPKPTKYFAYTALLDPRRIDSVAPGARFLFTAHFPETRLAFVGSEPEEAVPTLIAEVGQTVWGGVFEIPNDEVDSLTKAEGSEGRVSGWDHKAVDREGNKHSCLTFVSEATPNGELRPSEEYLESMIKGARHWSLPAGWVMGLEDLGEDPLFG